MEDKDKNSKSKETVENIRVIIEDDNKTNEADKEESPKTAKDLFSDFKPESEGSDYDPDGMEENDSDEDDDDEPLSKRAKKSPKSAKKSIKSNGTTPNSRKKYKKEWEEIPMVKPWLSESVHGQCYFYCKFCKKDYKCGKSELFKHMSSMKHKKHTSQPISPNSSQKIIIKPVLLKFRGLLCPVVTPFVRTRLKDISFDTIKPYSQFLKACGIKGVLVNDVMGEGMSLTIEERKRTAECWSKVCHENGQFLMLQIGGAPLKSVIELAIHAVKLKVGAFVLLPDLYNRPKSHLDLIRYIKTLSYSTGPIPIIYHHHPKYTNLEIDIKSFLLDITGEIDNFAGLIYSTGDLHESIAAMDLNPDKFVVFMGTDEGMLGAVASGFTCVMGNSINILPKLTESICCCIKNGEIKSAQASQNLLKKTLDHINGYGETVPAMKAAMSIILKLPLEQVREPLQTVWEGNIIKMREKLHEIGII